MALPGLFLMVEPFDGPTMAPTVIPRGVQAWIQIHKLPTFFRNKKNLTQLAKRVCEIIVFEPTVVQTKTWVFHRVRVKTLEQTSDTYCAARPREALLHVLSNQIQKITQANIAY